MGKGSSGGRARAWKVNHAGRYMGVGTEVGILTSVAMQLVVVLQISKRLGLEVGVEIRRPEAGAGSQSRIAKGIEFSQPYCSRCAMPWLLATLPPQFKQLHARSSCAPATVRCVCVQKGGGAMCAQQGARRTGAFDRPEADQVRSAGARSPSSTKTPFAVTGGHLALF